MSTTRSEGEADRTPGRTVTVVCTGHVYTAVGEHRFPAGWYAYTGSAFGPGGFSRVDRHRNIVPM